MYPVEVTNMDFIANIDWSSVAVGIATGAGSVMAWWYAIPRVKKNAAKAKIKEGLDNDGKLSLSEGALAALELL